MNNKGMAISSILYTILILFLALLFGILGLISSSKTTFDTLKKKLYTDINDTRPEVLLTVNQEDLSKMDIKIVSRKYIDSYYLTTSNSVNEQAFNTNKTQLENPSGIYTITQTIEHSTYYLYLKDIHDMFYKYKLELSSSPQGVYDFSYTGDIQTFTVPQTGMYKLEVWGAQGGSISTTYTGGKGGYASGIVTKLNKNDVLYVVVGGQGENCSGTSVTCNGGYNGGGNAKTYAESGAKAAAGGGATHIGTFNETLKVHGNTDGLYIVAAGGGGSHSTNNANRGSGGVGGGTTGGNPTKLGSDITKFASYRLSVSGTNEGPVCTQDGLNCSSFGAGGNPTRNASGNVGSGGGAGVYGGSAAYIGPGAGGASWIEGVTDGNTIAGDQEMPDYNGTTMTGNAGNGHARITSLTGGQTIGTVIPIINN